MSRLSLDRIQAATSFIDPVFLNSPQYRVKGLNEALGCPVLLKVETGNPVGSFKGRGAETVMSLPELKESKVRGVICASAGNLGQAIAYSARSHGIQTVVVAAASASPIKLEQIRKQGAELRLVTGDFEAAREVAARMAVSENLYLVEDSLNPATCEGAGTIGLELAEGMDSFDAVLIALGAGAMASGVGFVLKSLKPEMEVITVQPSGAPAMTLSLRAGEVVTTETMETIADGVAGRFPIPELVEDLLEIHDDALLVEEESLIEGMRHLHRFTGIVVEPSAALGVAAILENRSRFEGKSVATILCGGNILPEEFERLVNP